MLKRAGMCKRIRYYDIGFNLSDPMYQGVYRGKRYHKADVERILERCKESRVERMLLTGSSLVEVRQTIDLVDQYESLAKGLGLGLYYTIGVHPCCVNEFVTEEMMTLAEPSNDEAMNQALDVKDVEVTRTRLVELYQLMRERQEHDGRLRAIGEIGLDYDRFYYSGKNMQLLFFKEQLKLSCMFPDIPLFLHMRNCHSDFIGILGQFVEGFPDSEDRFRLKELILDTEHKDRMLDANGYPYYKFSDVRKFVVHSFTGTPNEMEEYLALSPNCYIGMNGTSLKHDYNIDSVRRIPLDRLLLETDAPWCEIRRTHESYPYLVQGEGDMPWLKEAYPDLDQWYASVKRDKLAKLDESKWAHTMVKSRNEPCTMGQVATVIANIKNVPLDELLEQVWLTTCSVYGD
ncbi:3'-5'-exodeoxyribonuclease Ecym_4702 [Eremothecium cymbalariae DBVPG|uniref:TatD related DNase n=1 Tax=Eremothecium cymbalariae (strain CBS 270.75 / DBVPG 7215 / KCTC 17166 / NRRL Y-17582) TaxID=931890 RepID=G8JSK0_ERECY|nr:hypothetical protein Ecym_4702 [Eremothecium cymbalariae DBVPG\